MLSKSLIEIITIESLLLRRKFEKSIFNICDLDLDTSVLKP